MIPAVVRAGKSSQEVSEISMPRQMSDAEIIAATARAPNSAKFSNSCADTPTPF